MTKEEAIKVNSISEEYNYISRQKCKCTGEYDKVSQAVYPHELLDQIKAVCKNCKAEKDFWFNISSFFGKM
ncbi:MAG: hypothetical protein HYU63_00295 [Armatimonadetes bacterium]|nr:hypothetical protein [Armatimonadota bacterium]